MPPISVVHCVQNVGLVDVNVVRGNRVKPLASSDVELTCAVKSAVEKNKHLLASYWEILLFLLFLLNELSH